MAEYSPPNSTNIPFDFTESGYSSPSTTDLLFHFRESQGSGNLQAAINVLQLYQDEAYTYPKSCPKYVVGYTPGHIQVIYGPCIYGGIRDLGASITATPSVYSEDLPASITGLGKTGQKDLGALLGAHSPGDLTSYIATHQPGNLGGIIEGLKKRGQANLGGLVGAHQPGELGSTIGTHQPADLNAKIRLRATGHEDLPGTIRPWYREISKDLGGTIDTHSPEDLGSQIDTHQPQNLAAEIGIHTPSDIVAFIRGWAREVPSDLSASVAGYQEGDLGGQVGVHGPSNLGVILRGWAREVYSDLQAYITGYTQTDLLAYIGVHQPANISASIRPWYREVIGNLPASIGAWSEGYLGGIIGTHPWINLTAKITTVPPPPLPAIIKGWVREAARDLPASTYGWQDGNLSGQIGAHAAGNLGIILKAVHLGVIRNLPASIWGWQEGDLTASVRVHSPRDLGMLLKGVALAVPYDLPANVHGWQEGNLGMTIKGGHLPGNLNGRLWAKLTGSKDLPASVWGWQEDNLGAVVGGHYPDNIGGSIRPWYSEYSDITANIYGWDQKDLGGIIGVHSPVDLGARIKGGARTGVNLPGLIHGWEYRNLTAQIFSQTAATRDLSAQTYGWQQSDLGAYFNMVYPKDLSAYIGVVGPENLPAYIKARLYGNLPAQTYGWEDSDLSAEVNQIYYRDLSAYLNGRLKPHADLGVRLKGVVEEQPDDLPAYLRALTFDNLSAYIYARYKADLPAYVFAVTPKDIGGTMHGWQEANLLVSINGQDYPWNLTASISSAGGYRNLPAFIGPKAGAGVTDGLPASMHVWYPYNLPAQISGEAAHVLGASITPLGHSRNLTANITPKMIRLTTLVNIPTINHSDLSATINYLCYQTGVRDLTAYLRPTFKGDLQGIINAYKPNDAAADLSAKIGYADSYSEVDKLKLSITILPNEAQVEDKMRLVFSVLRGGLFLSASINGTLQYSDLGASVTADQLDTYYYDSPIPNRERVVQRTYNSIFESIEYVEFAFKSIVKDYYYSSDGDYVWKSDRFERWMLDVKSYLPADTALRLKRRLHRATELYDLRKFNSVDEAMKWSIDYVTEYPQASLSASIFNRGTYQTLSASIRAPQTVSTSISLGSSVTAVGNTVVVGGNNITKI